MYKLEAIYWYDHWTTGTDWVSPEEAKSADYHVGLVITVGFVVKETKQFIVVSPILDTDDGSHRMENLILKSAIKKRKRIKLTT